MIRNNDGGIGTEGLLPCTTARRSRSGRTFWWRRSQRGRSWFLHSLHLSNRWAKQTNKQTTCDWLPQHCGNILRKVMCRKLVTDWRPAAQHAKPLTITLDLFTIKRWLDKPSVCYSLISIYNLLLSSANIYKLVAVSSSLSSSTLPQLKGHWSVPHCQDWLKTPHFFFFLGLTKCLILVTEPELWEKLDFELNSFSELENNWKAFTVRSQCTKIAVFPE